MINDIRKDVKHKYTLGEFIFVNLLLSILPVFSSFLYFIYQCIDCLRTGVWTPHAFIELFRWINSEWKGSLPWAIEPHSWFGLYSIFERLPLCVGLVVFAPIIGWIVWAGVVIAFIPMMIWVELENWASQRLGRRT